jgi:tripartite-type tricarboxylate transporter receptor subunit TctC
MGRVTFVIASATTCCRIERLGFGMEGKMKRILFAAALIAAMAQAVVAQEWPTKPIRVIIPFGAGSATDIIPRTIFEAISTELGQSLIVENRGGAGTTIGSTVVAKADPDGYTLLATSSAHSISQAVFPNLPYDTARDFAAVTPLAIGPNVLIVNAARGFRTAADFVAAAKAKPGSFNFASAGVGSATHLSAERFRIAAGYEAVHVPFKGGAEALTEILSGRIEYYFCPLGTAMPFIRDGKVVPLVVSTPKRAAGLPNVPSALELYPDSDYPFWLGVFAPAKTPRDIVEKFNRAVQKVLRTPEMQAKLDRLGVEAMVMGSAEFSDFTAKDLVSGMALAKAVGLKPN